MQLTLGRGMPSVQGTSTEIQLGLVWGNHITRSFIWHPGVADSGAKQLHIKGTAFIWHQDAVGFGVDHTGGGIKQVNLIQNKPVLLEGGWGGCI